uniref:Uncharacterized protein n=1 Tax=Timema monikensis TaxID=170555 RepID=A0A7R9HRB6_9NEOP|nr:unnamed protein product [Timema monikensis]
MKVLVVGTSMNVYKLVRIFVVTLEEQMICGALQTLNEEACEDVMEEAEETGLAPPGTELGESVSSSVVDLCDEFDSPL